VKGVTTELKMRGFVSIVHGLSASPDFSSAVAIVAERTQDWFRSESEKPWQEIAADVGIYVAAFFACLLVSPILIPVIVVVVVGYGLYKGGYALYNWGSTTIAQISSLCAEPAPEPLPDTHQPLDVLLDRQLHPPKKSFWSRYFSCLQ